MARTLLCSPPGTARPPTPAAMLKREPQHSGSQPQWLPLLALEMVVFSCNLRLKKQRHPAQSTGGDVAGWV